MIECCASGSCEVCRRPAGYTQECREQVRDYAPPWMRTRLPETMPSNAAAGGEQ